MTFTIDEQIKCLARELALRKNVYRKWVQSGRMKQSEADSEIGAMDAALQNLKAVYSPVAELAGMKTLVLYFPNDAERDGFVALVQEAKPGMVTRKL